MVTLFRRAYQTLGVLLTLNVFLYGTILAPQQVMGPECNAFEGIASSGFRAISTEKQPKRSVQAAMLQTAVEVKRRALVAALDGLIWLLGAPWRPTKSAIRVLTAPIRLVARITFTRLEREDTGSQEIRSFPDLGVGTLATETTVEALGCELGGGLKADKIETYRNSLL